MKLLLEAAGRQAAQQGLPLNTAKCVALYIVPIALNDRSGGTTVQDRFGSLIGQLTPSEEWRYFGVHFRAIELEKAGDTLEGELIGSQ